jgi:hypothetical protein
VLYFEIWRVCPSIKEAGIFVTVNEVAVMVSKIEKMAVAFWGFEKTLAIQGLCQDAKFQSTFKVRISHPTRTPT